MLISLMVARLAVVLYYIICAILWWGVLDPTGAMDDLKGLVQGLALAPVLLFICYVIVGIINEVVVYFS
tara:strand:- start:87 stop:293 length:207 start_codon:yes stop_codon:yes gene_type:complete